MLITTKPVEWVTMREEYGPNCWDNFIMYGTFKPRKLLHKGEQTPIEQQD